MKLSILIVFFQVLSFANVTVQSKQSDLKKYFASLVENGQFNGNVLVAEDGKIIYEASFGYADFKNGIANKKNTSFVIASLSKTLAATAILQLVQAGKISLGSPVKQYLPEFPYGNITITHLLSHTSGLPPYNAFFDSLRKKQPGKLFTNADFMEGVLLNPKPLIYQPGDKGNYDNINFIVLALLIEKQTGISYPKYISENVLKPANMTNTYFLPMKSQFSEPAMKPRAFSYLYPHRYSDSLVKATEVPFIVEYWSAYNFSGFGDYVSTVQDLLNYDKAYYEGKLLNSTMTEQAYTPVNLNSGRPNPANFGLGWEVWTDTRFGKVVYHNGNATGLSCTLIRNLTKHQTIILFDNIHSNNSQSTGFTALKILNGVKVPMAKKSLADIYARVLVKEGPETARKNLFALKGDTSQYYVSEDEINLLGYDFMGGIYNPNPYHFPEEHKYPEALATFKLNTELFPDSWNVYDSYGEILLTVGQKEEAIRMYKKSVELNPDNSGGRKQLELLSK